MNISVIIPTRNRAGILSKTLSSIRSQTLNTKEFEVLVIDNGSTDDTKKVCDDFTGHFNLKYFFEKEPGLHVGRNKGFKISVGDILVYIDDDIQAFPEWLQTINDAFSDDDVIMVGGKNLPMWECDPPKWIKEEWKKPAHEDRCVYQLSILDLGNEVKEINPNFCFGCNFSVRKALVQEAGGFHPDGMPKELIRFRGDGETYVSQIALQSGKKTIYHPKASVYHWVSKSRMTRSYFEERSFNQGISDSYTDLRNKVKPRVDYKTTARLYIRQLKTFIKQTFKIRNTPLTVEQLSVKPYQKGYRYHQKQFHTNRELRDWVFKKDYFV